MKLPSPSLVKNGKCKDWKLNLPNIKVRRGLGILLFQKALKMCMYISVSFKTNKTKTVVTSPFNHKAKKKKKKGIRFLFFNPAFSENVYSPIFLLRQELHSKQIFTMTWQAEQYLCFFNLKLPWTHSSLTIIKLLIRLLSVFKGCQSIHICI